MSHPPPGLGGGVARTGPPPGFGSSNSASGGSGGNNSSTAAAATGGSGGANGTAAIVRAQIVFLLTTFTEDSFDKSAAEIRSVSLLHHSPLFASHQLTRNSSRRTTRPICTTTMSVERLS